MRVLLVNKFYYPWLGGVETVVQQLAEGIKNFEVEVLCVSEQKNFSGQKNINGIKVTKLKQDFFLFSQPISLAMIGKIKKAQADIYHLHLPDAWSALAYLLAGSPGKLIVTYHSDLVRQKLVKPIYNWLINRLLSKAKFIVATSPNLVKYSAVLQKYKSKVKVIPLGIKPDKYKVTTDVVTEVRKKFGKDFCLAIGRYVPYKGFEYLIEAFQNIDQKLIIIGNGKLKTKYLELIKKLKLEQKVLLVPSPSFEELKAFYKLCSVFVLPSITENEAFGIVQLEAMYFNKPVISTNLKSGVPYVNQHQKTGLVVEPKNVNQLEKAIKTLQDQKIYQKLSRNNQQYILDNFTEQKMLAAYLKLYEQL